MTSERLQLYRDKIRSEKHEAFRKFFSLLTEYNARFNLTAITEEQAVYEKHFLDSVSGESLFPANASVLEVGSGAGFPSLPLKILRDDLTFTLVESTGKKCEFLKTAAKELGLNGVTVINGRAEELARDSLYREKYDVCCARAVARLNTLSEYCLPFVRVGGKFVAYKGNAEEELGEAKNALSVLGGKTTTVLQYALENGDKRSLVEITKIKHTPAVYPRGHGKERKQPL